MTPTDLHIQRKLEPDDDEFFEDESDPARERSWLLRLDHLTGELQIVAGPVSEIHPNDWDMALKAVLEADGDKPDTQLISLEQDSNGEIEAIEVDREYIDGVLEEIHEDIHPPPAPWTEGDVVP